MRRSLAAIALTAVLLWLILTYKSSPLPPAAPLRAAAGGTAPTTPTTPTAPIAPTHTAAPTTTPTLRTVTGADETNRYGDVQVALVFNGTRIVDVKNLKLPFDRARSHEISDQAGPWLRTEVLDAQSANIDTVGGATYTSESYAQSVQSALDKARA